MNSGIKEKAESAAFYTISFLVYCFVGWVYEVITMYKLGFGFVNRGFLHGCYLPIYGFCALFFLLAFHKIAEKRIRILKINVTPVIVFLCVFLTASVIEYTASYVLEKCFSLRLWSYNDYKYNLNGRIALSSSCFFGIGGLLIFYVIQPLLNKLRGKMKQGATIAVGAAIIIIMLADLIITLATGYHQAA